jgi:transcriptional regulator with XRE-family HTH domain
MAEHYNIAARVQSAVERSGLRKADIAERAGIRWAQLQKILTGQRPQVSADTVRRLACALEVSSDYLLGLTDDPTPPRRARRRRGRADDAPDKEEAA